MQIWLFALTAGGTSGAAELSKCSAELQTYILIVVFYMNAPLMNKVHHIRLIETQTSNAYGGDEVYIIIAT